MYASTTSASALSTAPKGFALVAQLEAPSIAKAHKTLTTCPSAGIYAMLRACGYWDAKDGGIHCDQGLEASFIDRENRILIHVPGEGSVFASPTPDSRIFIDYLAAR